MYISYIGFCSLTNNSINTASSVVRHSLLLDTLSGTRFQMSPEFEAVHMNVQTITENVFRQLKYVYRDQSRCIRTTMYHMNSALHLHYFTPSVCTCLTTSIRPSFNPFSRRRFGFVCRADEIVLAFRKSHMSSSCLDCGRGGFISDGCIP